MSAQFALWERVLVDSALAFAQVIQIDERRSGTYYIVQFPDSRTLWRHESELTRAPQPTPDNQSTNQRKAHT